VGPDELHEPVVEFWIDLAHAVLLACELIEFDSGNEATGR
jgi:hypothetical protein